MVVVQTGIATKPTIVRCPAAIFLALPPLQSLPGLLWCLLILHVVCSTLCLLLRTCFWSACDDKVTWSSFPQAIL